MLPVIIYDSDVSVCRLIKSQFSDYEDANSPKLKLYADTNSDAVAKRYIDSVDGMFVALLGLGAYPNRAFELGRQIYRRNRDSYVVYLLSAPDHIEALADSCLRPAGILTSPYTGEKLTKLLNRINQDYSQLVDDQNDEFVVLNSASGTNRLPVNKILYVEATEKKVTIHTDRQDLSVRSTLNTVQDMLPPERFLRCHRSFIVNASKVQNVDFVNMVLTLEGGEQVLFSRSYKNDMKQFFKGKGTEEDGA